MRDVYKRQSLPCAPKTKISSSKRAAEVQDFRGSLLSVS